LQQEELITVRATGGLIGGHRYGGESDREDLNTAGLIAFFARRALGGLDFLREVLGGFLDRAPDVPLERWLGPGQSVVYEWLYEEAPALFAAPVW
jgi:hypothetical protein